jgi:Calcineurin-like phosphoesterase
MPAVLNRLTAFLLAALLSPLGGACLRAEEPKPGVAPLVDGPYVLWEGREARVLAVRDGKAQASKLQPPYDLDLPGLGPLRLDPAPPPPALADFPIPLRIAAVSDIHGNLPGLVALLQAHGVINERRDWSFGQGHLVVVGDVFDRGSQVTGVFWLLRHLEAQAPAAGGRVHVLLGNHELHALRGDVRYLHPSYLHLQKELLGLDQKTLYGPTSEQGRWLRTRPVLLRIGPFLFTHGGPSPELLDQEKNLEAFNAAFRSIIDTGSPSPLGGRASPVWYRGLIPGKEATRPDATDGEVERMLEAFRVRIMVVGHSTLKQGIAAFHGGRVHGIDADLMSGGPGELWLFQKGACFRGRSDGSTLPLQVAGPLP